MSLATHALFFNTPNSRSPSDSPSQTPSLTFDPQWVRASQRFGDDLDVPPSITSMVLPLTFNSSSDVWTRELVATIRMDLFDQNIGFTLALGMHAFASLRTLARSDNGTSVMYQ